MNRSGQTQPRREQAAPERPALVRARLVLPMARPPLENGCVHVERGRITRVEQWPGRAPAGVAVTDLGEVVLMPGLINAHCHLDYTHLAGRIPPLKRFTDWIKAIVTLKAEWSDSEFAHSWLAGADMLLRTGTTTVANMEAVPDLLPDVWHGTPLRVVSFRELIHLKTVPPPEQVVQAATQAWARLSPPVEPRGLAPHAPYSTSAELLRHAAREARARGWLLSTHVAESEEEFEMFTRGRGPLYDWLRSQRAMADCGQGSPVEHLAQLGYLGEDLLAVHVNYLAPHDAPTLARHGVHVVHCPRSHAYFQHAPFPRQELTDHGVNLCLGTDSLVSVFKDRRQPLVLSLFEEMRLLARWTPECAPETILAMATIHGAKALRQAGHLGELTAGAWADLIALPFAHHAAHVAETLVHEPPPVTASMIGGRWVIPPAGAAATALPGHE